MIIHIYVCVYVYVYVYVYLYVHVHVHVHVYNYTDNKFSIYISLSLCLSLYHNNFYNLNDVHPISVIMPQPHLPKWPGAWATSCFWPKSSAWWRKAQRRMPAHRDKRRYRCTRAWGSRTRRELEWLGGLGCKMDG